MWDLDLYARLDLADAWAFVAPVNWYGPTSNLKLMFDRLVCMNGGNPDETLIDHKNPEKAMALEHAPEWEALSVNHLEGRTAAFFCYEDQGANEIGADGRPEALRHKAWFDPDEEPFEQTRQAYAPLVWQCRYSGIEVPDPLWMGSVSGKDLAYSDNQAEDMVREERIMRDFDDFTDRFAAFVAQKGKVPPGRYRAHGYEPPGKTLEEAKLAWRDIRMRLGRPPAGSSPAVQQAEGLNRDATLRPGRSEAKRQKT
jgi:hypothetical protein